MEKFKLHVLNIHAKNIGLNIQDGEQAEKNLENTQDAEAAHAIQSALKSASFIVTNNNWPLSLQQSCKISEIFPF